MDLTEIRKEIDDIDTQLISLFSHRMHLSKEVALYKQEHNLPILNKSREREILSRISSLCEEDLEWYSRILYSTIFDLSRSYQISLRKETTKLAEEIAAAVKSTSTLFPQKGLVACQGVEGAYSQIACDKMFAMPNILYFRNFEGVFQAVEKGLCEFGLLPIENSSYGSVNKVYDLMHHYHFHIIRSIKLHVDHHLLAKPDVSFSDIKEIFSHEQAVGQCSAFLAAHPDIKVTICENTAIAAKKVSESSRRDIAALSSRNCAELYGLSVLSQHVQNNDNNYTRFICIAKDLAIYPGADRISLMCTLSHQPGALYGLISKFSALGLNLTKLESRPIAGSDFEFMFYFDLEASVWSPETISLLSELSAENEQFVFLGSYREI